MTVTDTPTASSPTRHHMGSALSLWTVRRDLAAVDGFNAKTAVLLTKAVGTMWMFWLFNGIAFVSLPAAIKSGDLTILIAWVSSNWLQLILLPALMVGQAVQSAAADARAVKTFQDTELVLDRLDERTQGGIRTVLDAVNEVRDLVLDAKKPTPS